MNKLVIIFLISTGIFLSSCNETETTNTTSASSETSKTKVVNGEIKSVSVAEFEKLINEKTGLLLDVRTLGENKAGNIAGSKLIDVRSANFKTDIAALDKNVPVLVYCRSGGRSMSAAKILKASGFKKIYNLKGGFKAWSSKH